MLLAILFLILRLPSLFEPYWYGDEGIYLALGQGIRRGLLLYQQIHDNKPPSLYYLAALAHTVLGFRLILVLWMIPTICLFYRLAKKFLSPRLSYFSTFAFLLLTSIPLLEGNIANAEIFMLLPTIVGFLFFWNSSSLLSLFFSGLSLGFAFTFKVPVAVEFAFLFLWLLFFHSFNFKKLFVFTLSFALPISLYFVYFSLRGAAIPFLSSALLQNFGYLSSWATGTQQASATSGGLLWRGLFMLLFWSLSYFFYRKKYLSKTTFFILAWFFAALFGALLSGRPYPHYLIQILPSLCLLLSLFKNKLTLVLALPILIFSLIYYHFYYYPVFSYYFNFYSYALHLKNLTSYRNFFGQDMGDIYSVADKVKSLTSPGDSIYVWGDQSFLYPLSDRLPSTKYLVAYHVADFNGYDLTISQLKAKTPKVIIYFPQPSRLFPALDQLISNYYVLVDQIGSAYIFLLHS